MNILSLPNYYRPRVELGDGECKIEIGSYCFLYYSTGVRSVGAINYRHVLVVIDSAGNDVLWVTAETNDQEGESVVYLGRFMPRHHATLTQSPALIHAEFFVPVACEVARGILELPYERYTLTAIEDTHIAAIPEVFRENFPQGAPDEATQALMNKLVNAVVVSNKIEFGT